MQFSAKEDIDAPIGYVFAQLTDYRSFERAALRRGADVRRLDDLPSPGLGMAWEVSFTMRGRRRDIQMELTQVDAPNTLVLSSRSPAMGGSFVIDLVALSKSRTRMSMNLDLKPANLSTRLLVQSMKLARGRITKRYRNLILNLAKELAERHKRHLPTRSSG